MSLYLHAIVNLVDELRLRFLNCLLRRLGVFMWCQLHHCDGLFQNQQRHLHLDDLFDDSLWDVLLARELRLRTAVSAGVVHACCTTHSVAPLRVANSECFIAISFRRRVSENVDWFHLQVTIVLRSFFDFSVNHLCVLLHGETQVAPTTFTVEDILLLVLGPDLC